ncbi:MAG: alcohol dehydrogenase catalytic domain-containing protein [Nitrospirota bacterium]
MKVAKLYSFDDIRIEDISVPEIGPEEALMKTKASGICSGDVMPWYIEKKAPLVPGHEPAGEIVEIGNRVTSFKPGDRVFPHHHAPCLKCKYCKRGDYVQCKTWRKTKIVPGGISEYILIPEINLKNDTLKLNDGLSYEDGTLVEPAACVVKALKRANIKKGDTVLVIGLGVMGQLNILLSKRYGAAKIIGADMVPFRLEKAMESGADYVVDVSKDDLIDSLKDLTKGAMADLVVVGPNTVEAMKQGISASGPGGRILFFTPARPGERLQIEPNDLYFKDIDIITSYSCGPTDTAEALKFIEEGTVRAEKLVTHRFPIEKTAKAFRLTAEAKDSLKSVIVFE